MRVLVACEMSGVVRDAFLARGHDAYSCDLLDCMRGPERHLKCDVLSILDDSWDLAICHPPCTYLTNAGAKHLYIGGRKENGRDEERWENMRKGAEFFNKFIEAPIKKKVIENPIMHRHARVLILRPYSQIIQPYHHGVPETKATCLWLFGVDKMEPTNFLPPPYNPKCHFASPSPKSDPNRRQIERSITPEGVAKAFAERWG